MQNFKSVAIFVEVARAGSFTKAARRLRMPLSTVSRNIAELEDSLGTRLLERSTRSMRLTEVGRRYFEHCRRGVEAFETAARVVDESHEDLSGLLRLSIPPSIGETVIAPLIALFRTRYPKVSVAVVVSERNLDFIDDGIDMSFRPGVVTGDSLVALRLLTYRHILVATPAFLAEQGQPDKPEALTGFPLVAFGFPGKPTVDWQLARNNLTRQVTFTPAVAFNDYAAVRGAILNGLGIGDLPQILCADLLQSGKLVEVLPAWHFPTIGLHLVHPGRRNMPAVTAAFRESCRRYFKVMAQELTD